MNKEEKSVYNKQYHQEHRAEIMARKARYYHDNPSKHALDNARMRLKAYSILGDRCAVCGETDPKTLQFDHVNNDGAEHGREIGDKQRASIPRWIVNNQMEARSRIQLLCGNCHARKHSVLNILDRIGEKIA